MGVEINPVVDLAAAFTDEGQSHAIEESNAAADIGGSLMSGEVSSGRGGLRKFLDGVGQVWTAWWRLREVER
jgi:hypothetical protein